MGVITDLESLCNGVVQNVDHSTKLIREIVDSDKLDSAEMEEMWKVANLLYLVRTSISGFQHGMTFEKRFEEFLNNPNGSTVQ